MSDLLRITIAVSALLALSHIMIRASKPDDVALIRGTAGPNETPEEYDARMAAIWGEMDDMDKALALTEEMHDIATDLSESVRWSLKHGILSVNRGDESEEHF